MISVEFTKHARRDLRKLPADVRERIIKKTEWYILQLNPLHFADSIEGVKGKIHRFRIGDYRVIFDWEGDKILVTKVSHRREAY